MKTNCAHYGQSIQNQSVDVLIYAITLWEFPEVEIQIRSENNDDLRWRCRSKKLKQKRFSFRRYFSHSEFRTQYKLERKNVDLFHWIWIISIELWKFEIRIVNFSLPLFVFVRRLFANYCTHYLMPTFYCLVDGLEKIKWNDCHAKNISLDLNINPCTKTENHTNLQFFASFEDTLLQGFDFIAR